MYRTNVGNIQLYLVAMPLRCYTSAQRPSNTPRGGEGMTHLHYRQKVLLAQSLLPSRGGYLLAHTDSQEQTDSPARN